MKDLEIQELALEVMDMLGVALHFAGGKDIKKLIDLYLQELDEVPEDTPYNQEQMIALIEGLKKKYPKMFA
ncbi:hypothetical protein [uncultured Helicobacter sp.]|uniref:hypothetical protein n=1 Tax=uncultured Helicobacter sp. TaxID=175537 RepID=UPI001F9D8C56|nr:hypothetical protein [uncultured Helicobacter sp.]HIY44259.1 hypothetical protein [Candidatus Helicobacter avistercoris]